MLAHPAAAARSRLQPAGTPECPPKFGTFVAPERRTRSRTKQLLVLFQALKGGVPPTGAAPPTPPAPPAGARAARAARAAGGANSRLKVVLELIRVPSILRTSLLLTGAMVDLLQSRMPVRCVDVDIAMKIGYTIFQLSCVQNNQHTY
jgi:hypothetical protein